MLVASMALLGLLIGDGLSDARSQPVGRSSTTVQQEEMVIQREQVIVREPTIIRNAPPPLRTEVITVAPSPRHVWVPGYWTWGDDDWVWQSGDWEWRPYP